MSREGEFIFNAIGSAASWLINAPGRQIAIARENRRIAETVRPFLNRYAAILDDMREQNLDQYVRREYDNARSELAAARRLLDSNPLEARAASRSLGASIGPLPRRAREFRNNDLYVQRRQQREQERLAAINRQAEWERQQSQRQEQTRQQEQTRRQEQTRQQEQARRQERQRALFVNSLAQRTASAISDPVEADAAFDLITEIQERYARLANDPAANIDDLAASLDRDLAAARQTAVTLAAQWREKEAARNQNAAAADQVIAYRDVVAAAATNATSRELENLIDSLDQLKLQIQDGAFDPDQSQQALAAIEQETEQVLLREQVRKETIAALVQTLKSKGFLLAPPTIQNGLVELSGARPNGERCRFSVRLDGAFQYRFDRYEGSACKKDLNEVRQTLENVYGIALSDERVLWENPDRLDKESVDRPADGAADCISEK